jgi:hypothetical protein
MSDNKKVLYKREWLNEDEGTAYIIVDATHYSNGESLDINIEIKDCNRQINLDFWFNDEEERQVKLKKIDKLISIIQEARSVIANTTLKKRKVSKKK